MPMQQKLQNFWNQTDCEMVNCEPLPETLNSIMRFAAVFRSIPISQNHSVNFFLN